MSGAYFSPRAVKANEEAVRKMFAAPPNGSADDLCLSRMGQRLGPAYIRAVLDEVNRGTPTEVYAPTLLSIVGWVMANTVSAIPDPQERALQLGRYMAVVQHEAINFAVDNDIVETGAEAYGEPVGGHA